MPVSQTGQLLFLRIWLSSSDAVCPEPLLGEFLCFNCDAWFALRNRTSMFKAPSLANHHCYCSSRYHSPSLATLASRLLRTWICTMHIRAFRAVRFAHFQRCCRATLCRLWLPFKRLHISATRNNRYCYLVLKRQFILIWKHEVLPT